jgi:hypothetical protein
MSLTQFEPNMPSVVILSVVAPFFWAALGSTGQHWAALSSAGQHWAASTRGTNPIKNFKAIIYGFS